MRTTSLMRPVVGAMLATTMLLGPTALVGCGCSTSQTTGQGQSSQSATTVNDSKQEQEQETDKQDQATKTDDNASDAKADSSSKTDAKTDAKTDGSSKTDDAHANPTVEETVQLPDLYRHDADDAVQILSNIGLSVGRIDYQYHDDVPVGCVIKQNPSAYSTVLKGSRVTLLVSQGKQAPKTVKMPDLIGKTQEDAEWAVKNAGLVPVPANPVYSDTMRPGLVCEQSVRAGSNVVEGSQVSFAVSMGSRITTTTVPEVRGMSADDARDALRAANLGIDTASSYSDDIERDLVISQSVPAGTKVAQGTSVAITISLGAKPKERVKIPDVMTYSLDQAIQALQSAGLNYVYSGDPDGTVNAVDPPAGTEVEVGSTIIITLQHISTLVAVPDLNGMDGPSARAACEILGLELDYDVRHPERVLTGSIPSAGTLVDVGTMIEAQYKEEPVSVEVPDVAGLMGPDAEQVMEEVGLTLRYDEASPSAVLVGTDPAAGEIVQEGDVIDALYGGDIDLSGDDDDDKGDQGGDADLKAKADEWVRGHNATTVMTDAHKRAFAACVSDSDVKPYAAYEDAGAGSKRYVFLCTSPEGYRMVVISVIDDDDYDLVSNQVMDFRTSGEAIGIASLGKVLEHLLDMLKRIA